MILISQLSFSASTLASISRKISSHSHSEYDIEFSHTGGSKSEDNADEQERLISNSLNQKELYYSNEMPEIWSFATSNLIIYLMLQISTLLSRNDRSVLSRPAQYVIESLIVLSLLTLINLYCRGMKIITDEDCKFEETNNFFNYNINNKSKSNENVNFLQYKLKSIYRISFFNENDFPIIGKSRDIPFNVYLLLLPSFLWLFQEGVMKQIRENHPTYWNMPYFCETFELPSALNGTMSNSTASSFNNIFEVCDNHSQDMFLANLITSASFTIASRLIWRCFGNIPVEDPNEDRPFQTNIVIPRFVIEFLRYIVSIAYFGLIYFVNVMIDSQIKENNDRDVYLRYWLATPFYFCFFNYIVINDELSSKSVITVEELTVGDNPCLRFLKGKLYKREIWPFESKKNEEHKNVGRDNKVTLRHLFIRNSFLSLLYSILISELIKEYANNYKDGTNYVIIASLVFYSLSSSIDYFFNVWDDKNFESEKVNTDDFNNDLYNV